MGWNLFINYYETVAIILFGIGFASLLLNRNLVKKSIGLGIAETGVFLFFVARGHVIGRAPPIIVDGMNDASLYTNPLPTALMLTGIVVAVCMLAFSLSLIVSLYKRYETLNLDVIMKHVAQEEACE